ncbi:MAG: ShlB/FhaC/HecB family hemolysin secretion/activation protein, partial [Proteobacteria bacterium]|nr:ShlB/FhaC/HecB family hemolysin secretion/activation protein [Pseudomonadota bacterium]
EHDFRLLAEDPAMRTVNAELRPGAHPGEASLALSVYPQDRYDLYATFANDRSPSVGGERLSLGGSMRNALTAGDLLAGEIGVTGEDGGLYDAALSYAFPLAGPRTMGSLRAAYDDAVVVDSKLKPLDISARDRMVEGGLTHKLIDDPLLPDPDQDGRWRPAQSLTVGAFVVWRQSTIYLFGERFSFAPGEVDGRADYTALRLTADYVRRNVDQAFAASFTGTFGLDGTRSQVTGVTNPQPDYHAALAQLNYARRLSTAGLELRARLAGQWTDGVVYAGERFSAGGEYTVRGYRENLLLADRGLIGSLELAQPVHLGDRRGAASGFDWGALAISAFVDGAAMRN